MGLPPQTSTRRPGPREVTRERRPWRFLAARLSRIVTFIPIRSFSCLLQGYNLEPRHPYLLHDQEIPANGLWRAHYLGQPKGHSRDLRAYLRPWHPAHPPRHRGVWRVRKTGASRRCPEVRPWRIPGHSACHPPLGNLPSRRAYHCGCDRLRHDGSGAPGHGSRDAIKVDRGISGARGQKGAAKIQGFSGAGTIKSHHHASM